MAEEENIFKDKTPSQIAFMITKYWRRPNRSAEILLHKMMDSNKDDASVYDSFIFSSGYWNSPFADKVRTEMKCRIDKMRAEDHTSVKKIAKLNKLRWNGHDWEQVREPIPTTVRTEPVRESTSIPLTNEDMLNVLRSHPIACNPPSIREGSGRSMNEREEQSPPTRPAIEEILRGYRHNQSILDEGALT